jgi:hypothetical protein
MRARTRCSNPLKILNFDKNNKTIGIFSEGSGIRLLVQALDATGAFQNSENLSTPPKLSVKIYHC